MKPEHVPVELVAKSLVQDRREHGAAGAGCSDCSGRAHDTLKHGGTATSQIVIRYGASALEREVINTGVDTSASVKNSGCGLIGMRERVALYGGEVEAGTRNGGGYAVRVRLPWTGGAR